ncbi:MAG: hypothetical protein ACLSWY_07505 [Ruthenibacterium lactatiformans]
MLGYTGAAGDESGGTNASYGGLDVYAPDAISALDAFNASVKAHADELAGSWGNLFYAVTDDATGKTYTNTEAGLGGFLSDDPAKNGFDAAQWRYVLALRFDAQGNMSYAASYLGEEGQQDFSASIWNTDMQAYGTDAIRRHLDLDVLSYYDLSAPKSVTFVYGVPRVFAASDDISWYIATSQERSFINHAFDPLFAAALALAALLALWFGRRRGSGLGGGWLCRVPLELVLLALGCAVLMNGVLQRCNKQFRRQHRRRAAGRIQRGPALRGQHHGEPAVRGASVPVFGGDVGVCSRAAPGPGPGRLAGLSEKPQPGRTGRARFAAGRGARLACRERHAGAHVARPHRHRPAGPR